MRRIFYILVLALFISQSYFISSLNAEAITGPTTPAAPAKQDTSGDDRGGKSGAASAMAMAAAGMQMMSCMQMMQEAQKQTDPSTKSMMMMMAQQQCAQGAANMANAADNKKNQKQITQSDIPPQAQAQFSSTPLPSASPDPKFEFPEDKSLASEDTPVPDPVVEKIEGSDFITDKAPANIEVPTYANANGPSVSTPGLIDKPLITSDEGARKDSEGAKPVGTVDGAGNFLASGLFNSLLKTGADENGKKGPGEEKYPTPNSRSAGRDANVAEGGSTGGGSDKSSNAGSETLNFDSMMASLLGGPQPGTEIGNGFNMGADQIEVIPLPISPNSQGSKIINIFQFASLQYRDATYNQGRILAKKPTLKASLEP